MNYRSIFLSLLFAASFHPLQGQPFCSVETSSRNATFPYICNQDTFQIQIYPSGTVVDSIIIFWGDNTSDTVIQPIQLLIISHFYQTTGIFYPYYRVFSAACGDTIIEFSAWGILHPGIQDSLALDYVNYVIVADSCTSITGKAYLDEDSSCTYTPGDLPLSNMMVFAVKNNQHAGFAYTDALGNYTLWVPPSYDVFLSAGNLQSVLQPACNTTLAGNGLFAPDTNNHFIFSCPQGYDAQINSSTILLAQTVYRGLYFSVKNNSCTSYNNATVTFYLDNRIIPATTDSAVIYFNNGSFTPQLISPVISGNTVSIPGIHVVPMGMVSGYIYVKADPLQTTLNDTVCFRVTVTPDSGDINPANNADTICARVVTSYDPNDKNGQSNGRSAQGIIQSNQDVIYTIRFQNTGNFPAKDVRIVDSLDANLNLASITILSHSHPMEVQQSGNVVVFLFNDIWLPDSVSNEPESHGHVTFRIAQQPDLAPLTAISNFADIYFDYNPPVRTNTVVSVIESPTALPVKAETGRAIVYPNPVRERFTIKMAERGAYSIKIYDLMGRAILQEQIQGMQWEWNNRPLPGGFYLIEITHLQYRQVLKLVIED